MDDSCAVCADALEWVAYGSCGHRDVCSTCVVRLRFVLNDRHCCICKTENSTVFVTKAMGDYTRVIKDFSVFPKDASEGKTGDFWYHEGAQAFFDDADQYKMIKAMCRLSCSICDNSVGEQGSEVMKRRNRFRSIEQLKGHLYHQHRLYMCSLCLEGRKVFICEQKLYTRTQLDQHTNTGDSEVDGSESERGGFAGHPKCEFCKIPFYGDNELYLHMSTEHYTCHFCQRQHPGQYDYYKNYDDLETHFRQEHFLCEDEACLAKKFVVFQNESEMKKHNIMEHGGHMSRAKRHAVLQLPTSFRFRRSHDEDNRLGRGRGFRNDRSNNHLSSAVQASLEAGVGDLRVGDPIRPTTNGQSAMNQSVSTSGSIGPHVNSSPDLPSGHSSLHGQSSSNASILEDFSFPPLTDREPTQISSKYAQSLQSSSNAASLGEESFPPLPGMKKNGKQKAKKDLEELGRTTMAARLNLRNKPSLARNNPTLSYGLAPSSSAGLSQNRHTASAEPTASAPVISQPWGPAADRVLPSTSASLNRESGFISPVSSNSAWSASTTNKMKHSSSAPTLGEARSSHSTGNMVSSATGKQALEGSQPSQKSSQLLPQVENVHVANKSLVDRIRSSLDMDEDKFAAFKSISAEYRQDLINTWEYLSYVEQFGLSHLTVELARLCPDTRKQQELVEAYYASVRAKGLQENDGAHAIGPKDGKQSKKGKGKAKDEASGSVSAKESLAGSFLSTVKRLQEDRRTQDDDVVEVLSKDGYRASKDKGGTATSSGVKFSESSGADESLKNSRSSVQSSDVSGSSKPRKKTSKFHRVRLGDGSAAALLDLDRLNSSPERDGSEPTSNGSAGLLLPARGVWKNGGGQRLVASSSQKLSLSKN